MKKRIKKVIDSFFKILGSNEMRILPGQLAFNFLMSFVPILAIATLVASYLTQNYNLLSILENNLPDALASILDSVVNTNIENGNIILIVLCYIIMALNGPSAIIIASNTLYGIKQSSFLKTKLKAFLMVFILVGLLLFIVFIPVLGDTIASFIIKIAHNTEIYKYMGIYKILKLVLSFIIIYFLIKLLYTMAPDKEIKSKNTTLGALFTTFSWILLTRLFAIYISKIAQYNLLYGTFANILILLLWVYILAYLFVIGMAININEYKIEDKKD